MPVVRLDLHHAQQSPDSVLTPTGGSEALSDNSDSTYVEASAAGGGIWSFFDQYAGPVVGITRIEYFIRASAVSQTYASVSFGSLFDKKESSINWPNVLYWPNAALGLQTFPPVPVDGKVHAYSHLVDDSVLDYSGWDSVEDGGLDKIAAEFHDYALRMSLDDYTGGDSAVRIHGAWLEIEYPSLDGQVGPVRCQFVGLSR